MLKELEQKSIFIIREIKARFKNPAVLFSAGKDSTVMVHLMKKALYGDMFPIVHIDTGYKFKEIYEFRDKLVKDWDMRLIKAKNEGALSLGMNKDKGRETCCHQLKTEALKMIIDTYNFDAILVGIRRDEHGIRNKERFFSPRDKDFKWQYAKERKGGDSGLESLQDSEFDGWNIFATDFKDANHIRVHPLLHWDEFQIWQYIQQENIPVNPLYFAKNGKRYRSIGCECCTTPIGSTADNITKILKELKTIKGKERNGRAKDKEEVMESLRSLGYF